MEPFKMKITANQIQQIKFSINFQRLNIEIISIEILPGQPFPADEPTHEMTLKLLSNDLSELIQCGYFAAQQKTTFTLH
jgi:hypothetical protein